MKCMSVVCAIVAAAAAIASPEALAQDAQKAAIERARGIVKQVCSACHGQDGNSATPANPNLAGLPADYITLQLTHFQQGLRVNPVMNTMAKPLSPEDMTALGLYFSQQKSKGLAARDGTLAKAGQKLYRGGDALAQVPPCGSCHGPGGAGIPKNYPRLAGQYAEYTYAQLRAFKAGERGADKDDRDRNGRTMVAIASRLSDDQMKAVAEYTAGLR